MILNDQASLAPYYPSTLGLLGGSLRSEKEWKVEAGRSGSSPVAPAPSVDSGDRSPLYF